MQSGRIQDGKGNIICWGALVFKESPTPPLSPSSPPASPVCFKDYGLTQLFRISIVKKDLVDVFHDHLKNMTRADRTPAIINFFLTMASGYDKEDSPLTDRDKQLLVDFINASVTNQLVENFVDRIGIRRFINPPMDYFHIED